MEPFSFSASEEWPEITVECANPFYAAAMLSNIGSCNSEMSAVSLYFYNHIVTQTCEPEISECFRSISVVEMHHLQIFGTLAHLLGADPRLWKYNHRRPLYWSPACNHYPRPITALLQNSLQGEKEAISKYQFQIQQIHDCHIQAILNRIIQDEEIHVHIFETLLQNLE